MRYLMGLHSTRTEDSESISDDSVLKNSLTIQSITSSRDVSPFKGSRNSWSTSLLLSDNNNSLSNSQSAPQGSDSRTYHPSSSSISVSHSSSAASPASAIKPSSPHYLPSPRELSIGVQSDLGGLSSRPTSSKGGGGQGGDQCAIEIEFGGSSNQEPSSNTSSSSSATTIRSSTEKRLSTEL